MRRISITKARNWLKEGENQTFGVLISLFFLAMSVFWAIKPIRKSMFIGYFSEHPIDLFGTSLGGAQAEQLAKLSMVGLALIVALALPRLSRVLSMRQVLSLVSTIAVGGMAASVFLVNTPGVSFIWGFYLFGDFINSLLITLLWMLIHNSVDSIRAKKLYGAIGIGIVSGGVFGSFVLHQGIEVLGRQNIIALSILPLAAIGILGYLFVYGLADSGGKGNNCAADAAPVVELDEPSTNLLGTERLQSTSYRYWGAIALLVGLYEVSSGIIDFQLSVAVENINAVGFERDVYFGLIGQVQSILALLIQVFVTGWVIKRWGLGVALLILPFVMVLGSVGFFLIPTLISAMILAVSDNALNYSVNQSAKETLYVPTEAKERNRAKPIIDLFVQRFAKTFAIALNLVLVTQVSLENVRWLSLLAILLMISWIFIARFTSREFEQLTLNETKMV